MRLRLFSMYKRLKIKVEEERRRDKEVSLEKNTANKYAVQERAFFVLRELFPKKSKF
jgi:hypothetical protein